MLRYSSFIADACGCFGNKKGFPDEPLLGENIFLRSRNFGGGLNEDIKLNKLIFVNFTFDLLIYIFLIEFVQATSENFFVK
jgi:hypothetical protein